MNTQEAEILANYRALFTRYTPIIVNNGKQVTITANGNTTTLNQSQRNLSSRTIKLT